MPMTRRRFVQQVGAGAAAFAVHGCARPPKALEPEAIGAEHAARVREALGEDRQQLLADAARAPSAHNSQPWRVLLVGSDEWTVGADPSRRLPAVDPRDRELGLSLGAFVEYLSSAAEALALDARLEIVPGAATSGREVVHVRLGRASEGARGSEQLARIRRRRTLRKNFADDALSKDDLTALTGALGPRARWFPRGGREATWLAGATVEAFRRQTWSDAAQAELARWMRFGDDEAERAGDGLSPRTMEVGGLAGFYMRHFMDSASVMAKRFRETSIDMVAAQTHQGAGWWVLDATDDGPASLVEAGRRFARMALLLRERRLAAHPMSQVLEEEPWRRTIGRELGLDGVPQFVLRVGHVGDLPEPVSRRRPVASFVSFA
jgi:hypothetical protein